MRTKKVVSQHPVSQYVLLRFLVHLKSSTAEADLNPGIMLAPRIFSFSLGSGGEMDQMDADGEDTIA